MAQRLPIVGVMGSGREPHAERARPLGEWLARQRVHLLTGGGGGVMASVSEAFHAVPGRAGLVLAVLPARSSEHPDRAPPGYPNAWVEVPIRTHLPHSGQRGRDPLSRNHINVLTADVVVALPGAAGTASECALAVAYGRPLVAWVDQDSGLPPGTPRVATLEEVAAFVTAALQAAPTR